MKSWTCYLMTVWKLSRSWTPQGAHTLLMPTTHSLTVYIRYDRVGIEPTVCAALRRHPRVRRILFVSCNPTGRLLRKDFVVHGGTLGNSLEVLCKPPHEGAGEGTAFGVVFANAVDLFPHTPHCELVLQLDRLGVP